MWQEQTESGIKTTVGGQYRLHKTASGTYQVYVDVGRDGYVPASGLIHARSYEEALSLYLERKKKC